MPRRGWLGVLRVDRIHRRSRRGTRSGSEGWVAQKQREPSQRWRYDFGISELDLDKVRSFVAVAERLHFRRAAEELHIAQPALSRQIQSLEGQLGVALLVRDRRAVSLTPAGRQLLEDAGPLLAGADAARGRVRGGARGGRSLGGVCSGRRGGRSRWSSDSAPG